MIHVNTEYKKFQYFVVFILLPLGSGGSYEGHRSGQGDHLSEDSSAWHGEEVLPPKLPAAVHSHVWSEVQEEVLGSAPRTLQPSV
jgi:hypothetical protein